MKRPSTKAAAVVMTTIAAGALIAAGPARADGTFHGCPSGAVCVYNGASVDSGIEPGGIYWSYGPHNLSNQFGVHAVINNQTGGAWMRLCAGYNGGGSLIIAESPNTSYPSSWAQDLTPVNSIVLTPGIISPYCPDGL
ncbi:hypothetical protein ACFV0T_15545 [Streptomyces sp. NPDC059582]|uniref:hypothetical protein n=1 Tax=Streptomyces sp. NPDC059582 TaxID=3346875 RepID=UPI0036A490BC